MCLLTRVHNTETHTLYMEQVDSSISKNQVS